MSGWLVLGAGSAVVLGSAATLALLSALSRRPANLGARGGRLAPCPATLNCASSQAADRWHRVEPLRYEGSAGEALARLRGVLGRWPRTRVRAATETYVHAECRSRVFRFVDDVEFLLDAGAGVLHVRSASRVGVWDLGVNRRRVAGLRRAFAAVGGRGP
jgi:uncharacterized protein (DUF1499 family)